GVSWDTLTQIQKLASRPAQIRLRPKYQAAPPNVWQRSRGAGEACRFCYSRQELGNILGRNRGMDRHDKRRPADARDRRARWRGTSAATTGMTKNTIRLRSEVSQNDVSAARSSGRTGKMPLALEKAASHWVARREIHRAG